MHLAMQAAVDQVPGGVALADCEVRETKFIIPFVYGYAAYNVKAKVLVDPVLARRPARP